MSKIRIYELAKQLGVANKDLVAKINSIGIEAKSHMAMLTEEEAAKVTALYQPKKEEPKKDAPKKDATKQNQPKQNQPKQDGQKKENDRRQDGNRQERERAFHDILVAVKRNSYQYYMAKLGTDVNAVMKAVEGKKALEELQRAHISLE